MRGRNLLNGQHESGGVGDGTDAVIRLRRNRDIESAGRRGGGLARTVIVVVVERIAGRSSERSHQANQRNQRQTAQPGVASSSPGKTAQSNDARQQNGPCNGAGAMAKRRSGLSGELTLRLDQHGADRRATGCR